MAGLSVLARLVGVPYPILLVLGGLVLGYLPGMPDVELPPELVLEAFLAAAVLVRLLSPHDLQADARRSRCWRSGWSWPPTAAVAVLAHAMVDGMTWPAAFALGAIVSPTDPLAASAIGRRLGVPRRLLTVIEGESLVNDATALTIYRVAVAVAASGSFVAWRAGLRFVVGGRRPGRRPAGRLAGGRAAAPARRPGGRDRGLGVHRLRRLPAGRAARSVRGPGRRDRWLLRRLAGPGLSSAATRLLGFSFWEVLVYLVNAVLFILVGLQLPPDPRRPRGTAVAVLVGQGALVSAVVIEVRLGWGFSIPYLVRLIDRRPSQVMRRVGAEERGWSPAGAGCGGGVAGRRPGPAPGLPDAELDPVPDLLGDPGHPGRPGADPAHPDPAAARRGATTARSGRS